MRQFSRREWLTIAVSALATSREPSRRGRPGCRRGIGSRASFANTRRRVSIAPPPAWIRVQRAGWKSTFARPACRRRWRSFPVSRVDPVVTVLEGGGRRIGGTAVV